MVLSKSDVKFSSLVDKVLRLNTKDSELEGILEFETQNSLKILEIESNIKKTILKSSLVSLYIKDNENGLEKWVEVDINLIKGTLISRIKKMK